MHAENDIVYVHFAALTHLLRDVGWEEAGR